jgi:hypothetical protein
MLIAVFTVSAQTPIDNSQRIQNLKITDRQSELPNDLQIKCGNFFRELMDSTAGTAFDHILKDSPVAKNKEQIQNLVDQTLRAIDIYGIIKGFELVEAESATKSYLRVKFISLHSLYPMRWEFTFYKSPQLGWIVVNLKFDDQTDLFFIQE